MSLLPSTSSTESINSVQLANFSSVRISTTQRSMDHNNNHHSITTPIIREMQTDEKANDSTMIKNCKSTKLLRLIRLFFIFLVHHNRNIFKNRARLPLQPSTQQISSILPTTKKHKLPDE
jgi:hypothetical protein